MFRECLNRATHNQNERENTINTYGIGETAKRQMKRPTRARVIVARLDGWLMSTQGARVFFSVLTCVLTTLTALAITTERANFVETLIAILSVFAILGTVGALLVVDETSKRRENWWRAYSRDTIAELRATITRADNAHALEIGKLSKQLLDTIGERDEMRDTLTRERNETRAQLRDTQLGAHNLAWALVEDNDLRLVLGYKLSKIASEILSDERTQVFANVVLRDYAQDGLYAYDATLNAKLENGLVDWSNYGRDRD